MLFTEPVHHQPVLAHPGRKSSEIAVTADQAESLKAPRMQQIHRVDDQCTIACVLPDGVAVLLYWVNRMLGKFDFPGGKILTGEIPVNAPDSHAAVPRDFLQNWGNLPKYKNDF